MKLQLVYRYILSVTKNENLFYEKKKKDGNKERKEKRPMARVEPETTDVWNRCVIYCATTANINSTCQINHL